MCIIVGENLSFKNDVSSKRIHFELQRDDFDEDDDDQLKPVSH